MKHAIFAAFLLATVSHAQSDPVGRACTLWIKADAGITLDGQGRVIAATDHSGSGHNASVGAGQGPLLVPSVVGGLPAMRFDGGRWLSIAGLPLSSQQFTIIAVVNDTRSDGGFREVISNWDFGNTLSSVFLGTTSLDPAGPNTTRVRLTDDVGGANQGQGGVGTISNRTSHFILTGISRSTNAEVFQNRTLIAGRDTPISARNFSTPWVIGRQGPISEFWVGDIAEILVYNADLTRCELDAVYDYLNGRYGLAPCSPQITRPPFDVAICPGGTATLSVEAGGGTCTDNFTYRWTRNGQLLTDEGPYAGTSTPVLTIAGVTSQTVGEYRCTVSNACGDTPSPAANVITCFADFNCDAFVDFFDYDAFVFAFESGDPRADTNGDQFLDFFDYDEFMGLFESGC